MSIVDGSHEETIWQNIVPAEVQGRVFGFKRSISYIAPPIGFSFVGYLSVNLGSSTVFVLLGISLVVITVIQFFNRRLIKVGELKLKVSDL